MTPRARSRKFLWLVGVAFFLNLVRVEACARSSDDEARLAYLAERINHHDLPGFAPGHPFDGEWRLGVLSMSSLAATNLAVRNPAERARHAEQVSEWARLLASDEVRAYDTRQWGADPLTTLERSDGHAGYLGHVLLALDAACLLGGERDESFHRSLAEALARRIADAGSGLIETYPGETYVPDNVVVMAGLTQFDACTGQGEFTALRRAWLEQVTARWLDPNNGILVFAPGQPARGSGAAWNSFFLPLVDETFAVDQSNRMWATYGDEALGGWLAGIREGDGREGDVDSGPLVFGVSPSATGFALGDACSRGRAECLSLKRTAEVAGVTWGPRYLTAPLVGDAITLAARTMTRWPLRPLSDAIASSVSVPSVE